MSRPPVPDPLGDRMKAYEQFTRHYLPRRTFSVLRVDGRAFHTYLRKADKPYDLTFAADMVHVATELCKEVSGTVMAYTQSDEISLIIADFANPATQPWFGGNILKTVSVAASLATATLGERRPGTGRPLFDARIFPIPSRAETMRYLRWRQADCTRNSISMAGRAHMSAKRLHGMPSGAIVAALADEHDTIWADYPASFRNGVIVTREPVADTVTYTRRDTGKTLTVDIVRNHWTPNPAPPLDDTPGGCADTLLPHPKEE